MLGEMPPAVGIYPARKGAGGTFLRSVWAPIQSKAFVGRDRRLVVELCNECDQVLQEYARRVRLYRSLPLTKLGGPFRTLGLKCQPPVRVIALVMRLLS